MQFNQIVQEITHPTIGNVRLPAAPIRINEQRPPIYLAPPTIGEDTEDILLNTLSYDKETIQQLKLKKVI